MCWRLRTGQKEGAKVDYPALITQHLNLPHSLHNRRFKLVYYFTHLILKLHSFMHDPPRRWPPPPCHSLLGSGQGTEPRPLLMPSQSHAAFGRNPGDCLRMCELTDPLLTSTWFQHRALQSSVTVPRDVTQSAVNVALTQTTRG